VSVYVVTFRTRLAMTLKPDSGAVLRSTACEVSCPASIHERRTWLLDRTVAVRFVGGVTTASVGRRRPSSLDRQTATPSRRHVRMISLRH
jgi:hypothetical protein